MEKQLKNEFNEWIYDNYKYYYNYGFIIYLLLHISFIFFDLYIAKQNFPVIVLIRLLIPIILIFLTLFIYNKNHYKPYFIYYNILTVTIIPIMTIILSVICSGISQPFYIVYFGGINLLLIVTGLFIVDWRKTFVTNIFIALIFIFSIVKYSTNNEIITFFGLLSIILTVGSTSVFITYLNESVKFKIFLTQKRINEENYQKNKFFNIIAHDLKSPISAIMTLSELMNKEFDTLSREEINEYLRMFNKSISNTFNFINELLEWSRIQSKTLVINLNLTDLNLLIKNTLSILNQSLINKKLEVKNYVNLENQYNCDSAMIFTVLRNIISNSIKFTKDGGKIIINSEENEDNIIITVEDNGIGMSEKTQNNLFYLDSISSIRGTAGEIGTGLGLILCKEIIDLHKGRIWVKSEIGKGSIVSFSLPKT